MRKSALLKMRACALVLSGVIAVTKICNAQAAVSGTVTDAAGLEVRHASVEAMPMASGDHIGTVGDRLSPWIQADNQGRFTLNLVPGRYKIRAKAEPDGYPDPVFMLNNDPSREFPEISVMRESIQGLRVVLGRRGAILGGKVIDEESGSPIPHSKVTIRDALNTNAYVEVFTDIDGNFKFTVPSKPLLISASAVGFKPYNPAERNEITIPSGEQRDVVLRLQRQ